MPKIRVLSVDESKSSPSATPRSYVAVLSAEPDQNWKNNLGDVIRDARNSEVINVRAGERFKTSLSFTLTSRSVDLDHAISLIETWVERAGGEEEEATSKIRRINERLAKIA